MCLIKVHKINLELFPYPHKNRLVRMQLAEITIEKIKVMTKTSVSPIVILKSNFQFRDGWKQVPKSEIASLYSLQK